MTKISRLHSLVAHFASSRGGQAEMTHCSFLRQASFLCLCEEVLRRGNPERKQELSFRLPRLSFRLYGEISPLSFRPNKTLYSKFGSGEISRSLDKLEMTHIMSFQTTPHLSFRPCGEIFVFQGRDPCLPAGRSRLHSLVAHFASSRGGQAEMTKISPQGRDDTCSLSFRLDKFRYS